MKNGNGNNDNGNNGSYGQARRKAASGGNGSRWFWLFLGLIIGGLQRQPVFRNSFMETITDTTSTSFYNQGNPQQDHGSFNTGSSFSSSSNETVGENKNKLKIAILSGFVTNPDLDDFVIKNGTIRRRVSRPKHTQRQQRISDNLMDHLLNKVCYSYLWGYDYIFNTTDGFPNKTKRQYWLDYGTWHRVPHMLDVIEKYDWILYADTDYVIQDLSLPLEAFIKDWELHQHKDVSVFVPVDVNSPRFVFSAYAVMIRNSPFGRRMLENWMEFGNGLCENGNFATTPGRYHWGDSDQPGIWYALAKTHSEFSNEPFDGAKCNETSGVLLTERFMGPETNKYFQKVSAKHGSQGQELDKVPQSQPILWSILDTETRGGVGIQMTYGAYAKKDADPFRHAFAKHIKLPLTGTMKADVEHCRKSFNCTAHYTDDGVFHYGCGDQLHHVPPTR